MSGSSESGSTAVVIYLCGDQLWVANAGDSRVIMSQQQFLVPLTNDHHPDVPEELERFEFQRTILNFRITKNGGTVTGGRVAGKLAVSRSFGDPLFKNKENSSASWIIPTPGSATFSRD